MSRADELHELWAAEPSSVGLARASVSAYARENGAGSRTLDGVRLAVSEAATNVVMHAYVGRDPGPLDVRARVRGRRLEVEVSDQGGGLRSRPDSPGLGIGLPLISAVADSVRTSRQPGSANRVCMTFRLDAAGQPVA